MEAAELKEINKTVNFKPTVILATQEAQIRRIAVQSQPGQTVCETLSRKISAQKWSGGVTQGRGPEFKLQYCKKKKSRQRLSTQPHTIYKKHI
jgi:hypothetical protein